MSKDLKIGPVPAAPGRRNVTLVTEGHGIEAEPPEPTRRRNATTIALTVLIALLVLLYILPALFFTVHAGHAAVLWYRFFGGTDVEHVYSEGTRIKFPWDLVHIYDLRLRQESRVLDVLTKDGLLVHVHVSVRYRLLRDVLGTLHKNVGPQYLETLLLPEVGAHVRNRISQYTPEQLYSLQRDRVQSEILARLRDNSKFLFAVHGDKRHAFYIEDVLLRSIVLPPQIEKAVQNKLTQQQRALEYVFILQQEEQELRRKEIEAEGIRRFQEIISSGISDRYLRWKGIDATLELARSDNAKMVVIGAGEDGLPLILGGFEPTAAQPPGAVAKPGGAPRNGQPGPPARRSNAPAAPTLESPGPAQSPP